jgi:hypothetical protein
VVAVAGALPQHDLALLGEGAADRGDEPEGLVDGDEEEHALAVVDRLLVLAHVRVHEPHQEAQQCRDAKLDMWYICVCVHMDEWMDVHVQCKGSGQAVSVKPRPLRIQE